MRGMMRRFLELVSASEGTMHRLAPQANHGLAPQAIIQLAPQASSLPPLPPFNFTNPFPQARRRGASCARSISPDLGTGSLR